MIKVNIHEAKAKLSEYLEATARGERVLICKRNRPVAELRAVVSAPSIMRPIGGAKGRLGVPASFFEPLPEEWVSSFWAEHPPAPTATRVAERSNVPYVARRPARGKGRRP